MNALPFEPKNQGAAKGVYLKRLRRGSFKTVVQNFFPGLGPAIACGDGGEGSCGGVGGGRDSAVKRLHSMDGVRGRAEGHTQEHTGTHR